MRTSWYTPDPTHPSRLTLVEGLAKDIRNGLRMLYRAPGFAISAIISLAIGIGANTAMFSVVYGVLLRPLPYREPDRLVTLWSENQRLGITEEPSGFGTFEDWRKSARTFSGVAAYDPISIIVTSGEARWSSALLTTPNYAQVLGVQPLLGRMFTDDEAARRAPVAVLSYASWQNRHGGRPDILGQRIDVDGSPLEIVGVLPAGLPDDDTELWMPHTLRGNAAQLARGVGSWRAIGRLAPGVSLANARRELSGISATLEREYPATNNGLGIRVIPIAEHIVGRDLRNALLILLGAVGAVLLIACSNVGNLLLARGLTRQREFALRISLGATRSRLVAQLLVESLVLCLLAAIVGSALAWLAINVIRAFGPPNIPRLDTVALDLRMLALAVALSVASACVFALLPALQSTNRDPLAMMRSGGHGSTEGARSRRLRSALVVAECALAVILFAGAGMLVRSFVQLLAVNPGFRIENVLVAGLRMPANRPEHDAIQYAAEVVQRVEALPGVTAAAVSEEVLLGERGERALSADGATAGEIATVRMSLSSDAISPEYFHALGVPLLDGRFFSARDVADAPPVVIINETLARRLWPNGNAVGRRLRSGGLDSDQPWATVVGVVGDQRRQKLDRVPIPQAFWPLTQRPGRGLNLIVRTSLEPSALTATVRRTAQSVDATVPVQSITTLRQLIDRTLAPRRFHTGLLTVFAGIAFVLAGVGIFGVMHYSVARRTHEIGVRTALGASAPQVLKQILGEGLTLAGLGVAIGIAGAVALSRVFAALLFEVSPTDPLSFGEAAVAMIAIATLACLLPAQRASRIDPMSALRAE